MPSSKNLCFTRFKSKIDHIRLPEKFTFPFCYEPHPLAMMAVLEVQNNQLNEALLKHDFGLTDDRGLGKMFGVLVVKNNKNQLGYLLAFSGKLYGGNHYAGFVPPIFDTLDEKGFYKKGEAKINEINRKIEALELDETYISAIELKLQKEQEFEKAIERLKKVSKEAKAQRKKQRSEASALKDAKAATMLMATLDQESIRQHYEIKEAKRYWQQRLDEIQQCIDAQLKTINALKELRKTKSALLQQKLFTKYNFLNSNGEKKNLLQIFNGTNDLPPSGAGECAAPKLLQHAFLNGFTPIAMAEFWWGQSPASEIRKHGQFYAACKSKCEPILKHMLEGIDLDENPMLTNPGADKILPIVYEDEYLLVVNKPTEFLSVPGKNIVDSVYSRMKKMLPLATGPLIVHRLDMSTSGLLLVAKSKEVHQNLQSQFIKRKIKKRYTAILEGQLEGDEGAIHLPLRVDLDDRPRQLVCFTYGKPAETRWKVVERNKHQVRVHFFPITGRTHQLRVHASHVDGLNAAIKGDDLYGNRADRLYLHAESLEFEHPVFKKTMCIEENAAF